MLVLQPMTWVAQVYEREAPAISQARLFLFWASTILDLLEDPVACANGPARTRSSLFAEAHELLWRAEQLAKQAYDLAGLNLLQLAYARFARLRGDNSDRQGSIESVIRTATQVDECALLAQAFTALGDELAGRNTPEPLRALDCYRQAIGLLDGSSVPILALPARRKLLIAGEMMGTWGAHRLGAHRSLPGRHAPPHGAHNLTPLQPQRTRRPAQARSACRGEKGQAFQ